MGDPGAVVAVAGLALLVGPHLREGLLVGDRVVLDRDLRRHAADRVRAAPVARLDREQRVAAHEVGGHRDQGPVGEHEVRAAAELLDDAEDVVPAAAVQPGRVVAQLVEDLLHLERREDRLDEHRRADAALRDAELVLGHHDDVVPEARLEVALHLGQVEVRTRALVEQLLRVVEHVEREVEDAGRDRVAVDQDVLLEQVPAARAHEQGRQVLAERVVLAAARQRDGAVDRVAQVDLTLDRVLPGRRVRVLEVGHEHLRAGVQRVDDHLAVHRPGDLGATVLEVGGGGCDLPRRVVADALGLGQEVRELAGVQAGGPLYPRLEQLAPARLEGPVQLRHQGERVGGKDLRHLRRDLGRDLDSLRQGDRAHLPGAPFLDASTPGGYPIGRPARSAARIPRPGGDPGGSASGRPPISSRPAPGRRPRRGAGAPGGAPRRAPPRVRSGARAGGGRGRCRW